MKTKLHLIIMTLVLLFMAGGHSVCLASEDWEYPTSKPWTLFGGGDGSWSDPDRIETAQHLANLAYMVTDNNTEYKGKYFVLTNDITLNYNVINNEGTGLKNDESSYKLWTPIGEYGTTADDDFMGHFDGQGHTISGLVCIDSGDREYMGLFGTTDQATIKNLNIKDSYVCAKATQTSWQSYGILIGESSKTTVINCHVSNSVVNVTHTYYTILNDECVVGGLIGNCDKDTPFAVSYNESTMTNCDFSGNIYVTTDGDNNNLYVGGLIGNQNYFNCKLYLTNCNTEGDIYIKCNQKVDILKAGGIASYIHGEDSELQTCVNRMNITLESGDITIERCYLSGFCDADLPHKASQCVSLGTIKVGSDSNKVKIGSVVKF